MSSSQPIQAHMRTNRKNTNVFICSHEEDPFFQEGRSRTLWAANMANAFADLDYTTYLTASIKNTPVRGSSKQQKLKWIKDEVNNFFNCPNCFSILDSSELTSYLNSKPAESILVTRSPLLAISASNKDIRVALEDHDEDIQKSSRAEYLDQCYRVKYLKIFAISSSIAAELKTIAQANINIDVLPSGVNTEHLIPIPKLPKPVSFVYMGGLHPERGVDYIYEAAPFFEDNIFYIFGGRPKEVIKLRERYSESNNLVFAGFHKSKDIYKFLGSINPVFIYTRHVSSLAGTSPLKLIEYIKSSSCIVRPEYNHISSACPSDYIFDYDAASFSSFRTALSAASRCQAVLTGPKSHAMQTLRLKYLERYSWNTRACTIINSIGG